MINHCQEIQSYWDAYFDGYIDSLSKRQFEQHIKDCSDCQQRYQDELYIINSLKTLPVIKCPSHVTKAILKDIESEHVSLLDRLSNFVFGKLYVRWAIAGIMVIGIALLFTLKEINPQRPITKKTYTQEELDRAKTEAVYGLLLAAQKINKKENDIVGNIIMNELPETIRNALKKAIPILKGGK